MHNLYVLIQALFGIVFLIGLTFCFSENKKAINWRLVISAFLLQNALFLLIRYVPFINAGIGYISAGILGLLAYAQEGGSFIFGGFVNTEKFGFAFILILVPTLVFFGSFIGLLYFLGIIQRVIGVLAYVLRKTVKLSGVESLVVISDIFLGQSEGPLVIGPYIKSMTRSELACAFVAGMSNIAGSVLGMYVTFLSGGDHAQAIIFANFLVTATFMNAASAVIFAKILFPETNFDNASSEKIELSAAHFIGSSSLFDSITEGALTGLKVSAAIVAVLMAVISLVHFLDGVLLWFGGIVKINHFIIESTNGVFKGLSLEYVLGQIFRIFAFFMGISWSETLNVGSLLGQKVAINEFVAYMSLGQMKLQHILSANAVFISTFALASFSNFSSIGIGLGVYGVLAPSRRQELAAMAGKALFGAVLAGFMTATVAGFWHTVIG